MRYLPISPFPFWHDLKKYNTIALGRDLIAAISVALLGLPQAVAYAFVADLPLSVGIFAAIFGTIFTASLGASRYLISGPTTAVAILIQSSTSEILFTFYRGVVGAERDFIALNIVMQITLLVGIFQVVGSLVRLGRLTKFASRSVIIGYMLGVAVATIVNQLAPFFGVPNSPGYSPIYMKAWLFFSNFSLFDWMSMLVGLISLLCIALLYRISSKMPAPLIVLGIAGVVAYFAHLPVDTLAKMGSLYDEIPYFHWPQFEVHVLIAAVPAAFAIALISLLEATSVGRYYVRSKEPPYADNQELFGLGVSNFLSSLLAAMPSSGSFSRTALNRSLNAKTRFAAIYSGLILLIIVMLLSDMVAKIPIAALSALLFYIGYTMINFRDLTLCLSTTATDRFVVLITFFSSLVFALDVALYIGIICSIVFYLKEASVPFLIEYDFNNVGKLRPLDDEEERLDQRICILQAEGQLFFGAADMLQSKIYRVAEEEGLKVVILQLLNVRTVDASICLALRQIHRFLAETGRRLMIVGISEEVAKMLSKSGVDKEIGMGNIFIANEQLPSDSTRTAYAQAKAQL